jgi:hypothetical protein
MKKHFLLILTAIAAALYFLFSKKSTSVSVTSLAPAPTFASGISAIVPKIQSQNLIATPIGLVSTDNASDTVVASGGGCGCGC